MRHLAGVEEASRSRLQGWIGAGQVRVNGRVARRAAERLAVGDQVEVVLPAPPPARQPPVAQPLPLAILYEDQHLLVLDKPAGLVVHPACGHRDGTLVNAVAWHLLAGAGDGSNGDGSNGDGSNGDAGGGSASDPEEGASAAEMRPGLVSRLDRDTSGVLLVAKTRAAHAGLARAVAVRTLRKDYLAVVYGRAPLSKGRIELRLQRDPGDRRRMVATRGEGLTAVTLYELLAEAGSPGDGGWLSLLACRLVTGRTHQIRVHLAASGLPIVGDRIYGEPRHRGIGDPALAALCRDFPRQALHAWRLTLRHPVGGQTLAFEAPLPADLRRLCAGASAAADGGARDAWMPALDG